MRGSRPVLRGENAKETFESIPVIDVSGLFSSNVEDRKKVASEIGKACRTVGFFYAQNHSVPEDVIESTFEAIKGFFALPLEDKMEVHLHKNAALRGYEPVFETNLEGAGRGGEYIRKAWEQDANWVGRHERSLPDWPGCFRARTSCTFFP